MKFALESENQRNCACSACGEKIAKMSGKGMDNIVLGSYPPGYPQRPLISDQPYLVLDPKKIKSKLGWEPKVSLEQGLRRTIDYWKQNT